jgi:SOS-response transcriptional repressor LexA
MKRIPKTSKKGDILDAEYLEIETTAPRSNIIPFPTNIRKFKEENPLPKRVQSVPEKMVGQDFVTVTVQGDSLRDLGIADGDSLICQRDFDRSELKNGKLVVAQLPCLGLVVKFLYLLGNKIILRSANPRFEDLIYAADLVEVKAIVVQSVKNWN